MPKRKFKILKNEHRQALVEKYAERRADLKKKIKSADVDIQEKFRLQLELAALPRDSAKVRIKRRCPISGRSRGYYRDFNMSRIVLREYAGFMLIPGLIKSSW